MQFKSSERKIYELNHQFKSIGYSKNTDQFEANFAAFIAAGRSVTMALQNDGGITFKDGKLNKEGDVPGFAQWYVGRQDEMRKDELCKYFKDIRDIDIHTGNTLIDSSYLLSGPVTLNAPKDGILEISGRGVYEVFGKNTPHELKVQKQLDGLENFQVHLQNIPKIHKGKDIGDVSIVEFCSLYKKYLEELVLEAKIIFLDK